MVQAILALLTEMSLTEVFVLRQTELGSKATKEQNT